jgi:hypothetical protein
MYARFRVCRISFRERDPGVTTDFGVTTGNFIPQQERERKRERERERERGGRKKSENGSMVPQIHWGRNLSGRAEWRTSC